MQGVSNATICQSFLQKSSDREKRAKNTKETGFLCFIYDRTGVSVVITIFCDFRQISANKLAFFLTNNVMIQF
jgi:hypothetical protein